jgi:hypothetical protein
MDQVNSAASVAEGGVCDTCGGTGTIRRPYSSVERMPCPICKQEVATASAGPVIVYGPRGCGKTRHGEALAAHFGLGRIVDEWMPGDPVEPGALHLSQVEVPGAVAYESLKAELRLA